ncbi:acetyl-CoA carboxylase carboxyltransferase subunit alpha [Deinococcus cellulosilyticus]|uniref:Acetyl-coenzyme A carboxylase carboxyl transferase subunit alpha n=1 Tax=Deinococcus cellulosilyticus (strain DSM 18568 / NBRC 106333 / KACC 11606 / 5516J-15) TaxID=1223518 RepID=A0A511NBM3_DEIC1|nr:acetyl-CoA carboxylase carboxyltransferase subunit alpha [Deinococcus cellulosilyticus]GEM49997.1 acetyl-coenzyme A carboxylase carboxyl transferase subunit alpha [Deinococcus cellulosilyticus NBRC 106333 = KACC 11606]
MSLADLEKTLSELERTSQETGVDLSSEIINVKHKIEQTRAQTHTQVSRWERVQLARLPGRPTSLDYVERIFTDFVELHGDRAFGDDQALIGGPAKLGDRSVMLIMQQRGKDTKDNIRRNFAMAHPEGYRKAMRLMDLADKFKLPVIALIDTQGAYPGIAAEERGQAWAIAESIQRMSLLKVPAISVVLSEGGSGGALAIGVGNRVLMMENAWYSVISPESCAAILWRDSKEAAKAAEALKLTAPDLLELGIVEEVVPEPKGGAHLDPNYAAENLRAALERQLDDLSKLGPDELVEQRAARFRSLGVFVEI